MNLFTALNQAFTYNLRRQTGDNALARVAMLNEVVKKINRSSAYTLYNLEVTQTGAGNGVIGVMRGKAYCPCACGTSSVTCVKCLTIAAESCTDCNTGVGDSSNFTRQSAGVYKFTFTGLPLEVLNAGAGYTVNVGPPDNPKVAFAVVKSGVANEFLLKTALFAAGDFTLTDGLLTDTVVEIKIWDLLSTVGSQ